MRKYLRAMIKGSSKTKVYLWTIAVTALGSLACLGASILGAGLGFSYVAFGGIIFSVMFSQLGTFKDVNGEIKNQDLLEKSVKNRKHQSLEEQGEASKMKKKLEEEELDSENELNKYTKDALKKYLVAYKVKQENYKILIDSSEKYHIKNCPAFIWSDRNHLFLLLLEKKPRMLTIARADVEIMRYERGIAIKDIEEYKKVKDSVLGSLFEKVYPEYYKKRVNGLTTFMKNLFVVGEDIRITTPSAAGMIKATKCRLELSGKQFDRNRFNGYFEDVYKMNLLFKEKALSCEEYEACVRELLVNYAEHEESLESFRNTVYQLVQYNIISEEYAEFYMNYKGELEAKHKRGDEHGK